MPLAPLFAFIDSLDRLDLHRPLNKHCPQKVNERLNSSCAFLLFWSERGGYNGAGRAEAGGCQISSALLPVPVCGAGEGLGRGGGGTWHCGVKTTSASASGLSRPPCTDTEGCHISLDATLDPGHKQHTCGQTLGGTAQAPRLLERPKARRAVGVSRLQQSAEKRFKLTDAGTEKANT